MRKWIVINPPVTNEYDHGVALMLTVTGANGESLLPFTVGSSVQEVLIANEVMTAAHCGGNGSCGNCRVRVEGPRCPPTSSELRVLSAAEIHRGVRLACQLRPKSDMCISVEDWQSNTTWRKLDEVDLPAVVPAIGSVPTGKGTHGIAIDFGTTQIRISLWDLCGQRRLAAMVCTNPLMRFGSDILNRVHYAARSSEMVDEMKRLTGNKIAEAIALFGEAEGVSCTDIDRVTMVANTAMLSLASGANSHLLLSPENWTQEVDCQPTDRDSIKRLWGLDSHTTIDFIPSIAGFVGSDLLAAVLYTDMTQRYERAMLIDFGTNSEIALWDGQTLWVTSAAGGPAFDGCGLSCGMPAEDGAIYQAKLKSGEPAFDCKTLGGQMPRGICGSGLIDVIAGLLQAGLLRPQGRFTQELESKEAEICQGITLNARDVDTFQRAKAAIGTGVVCLADAAGLLLDDLECIIICGAFGRHINVANAKAVGLLPSTSTDCIGLCGNAALGGSESLMLSDDPRSIVCAMKEISKVVHLIEYPDFETLYPDNLYLKPIVSMGGSHNHV